MTRCCCVYDDDDDDDDADVDTGGVVDGCSGGYAVGTPLGFAPTWEMDAACRYFAARGWVAMSMDYRCVGSVYSSSLVLLLSQSL